VTAVTRLTGCSSSSRSAGCGSTAGDVDDRRHDPRAHAGAGRDGERRPGDVGALGHLDGTSAA
jgi:hypothetical protein